jgi:hypothetical protein
LVGEPPLTDAEVEILIVQLATGELSTSQVMEVIDTKNVVRLKFLVMNSGDFFSYALSAGYELNYRDSFMGGIRESGYCIHPRTVPDETHLGKIT